MRALADQDHPTLERWAGMADAETAVVQDAHLGGYPVCLLGIESRPVPRRGFPPTDGPDTYTAGTLFPRSSKKAARAINAASGNRPLVVLANLSGFDGSPDSMRNLQLEYGAEIGRAIVNFDGPIVFCVISRYHGGAFVVFSKALNPNMTVLALEGSFASVIGGAPAAAVVFAGEVEKRTSADPRLQELEAQDRRRDRDPSGVALVVELADLRAAVRAGEDRRGRRRVRRRARHPPGGPGRLGRRGDHRRPAPAADDRGDREGSRRTVTEVPPPSITVVRMSGAKNRAELPVLVLGPASGTSANSLWAACAGQLADAFDLLALDLPGQGYNVGVPEGPFTVAELRGGGARRGRRRTGRAG